MEVPPSQLVGYTARGGEPVGDAFFGGYLYGWRTGDGWRIVTAPKPPLLMPWHRVTLASMLIAIAVLALAAWAIARAISRPLEQLAAVAGRARPSAPLGALPTVGSREVRELSHAVGAMHARLTSHAQGRTAMLAAIAHDLGTPLSRLAFRIEQLPEAARLKGAADIEEMRAMIAAALRFARDDLVQGDSVRIDLGSLLDSVVEDMRELGADIALDLSGRAVVRGEGAALRRLFANLLENAVRYGERAQVGWTVSDSGV
jgi:signal transduction histidine kinase